MKNYKIAVAGTGLMGIPIPAALTRAVDVLKQRADKADDQ